jgi:pyruvyltransferase
MYKVWWLGGSDGRGNFGDVLTPYILDHFNIKYNFVKKHRDADILCVGSIARRANENTTVLGSGIIDSNDKISKLADWRLVRGPLTRNRILQLGGKCKENYGDPALLLPLFCDESKKEHDVGYVPHHINYGEFIKNNPNNFVIQLRHLHRSPLDTAKEITKCRQIISSSLHGIIAAHSYGIPAAWVDSENKLKGDDVKFYDYFASVGIENPQKTTVDNPIFTLPTINRVSDIISAFEEVKHD